MTNGTGLPPGEYAWAFTFEARGSRIGYDDAGSPKVACTRTHYDTKPANQQPQGSIFMSTTSTRAQAIAEILWELKKADKLATLTSIANRAGFSAGSNGRTVSKYLQTVRRDWPQLQWWRAIADNGQLEE